jgi:hypothetical protein
MFSKELLAFLILGSALFGGIVVTCLSQRIRDGFFMLMVFLAPKTELYDVNFVSRDWYRGTVRGFEVSIIDVMSLSILVSMVLVPRKGESRLYWPPALGAMLLFFLFAAFNVGMADPKLFGLFELSKMLRGLVIFMAVALYVRGPRELRLFLIAWALMIAYQALLAIEQRYRFGIHRVFGTLVEANSLSVFFCTAAPLLVAAFNSRVPVWLKGLAAGTLALAAVGEILTISRAGVVVFGMVLAGTMVWTMSFKITVQKFVISALVVVGAAGMLAKSWKTLQERFKSSSMEEEYGSKRNMGRGYYIRLATTIAGERILGVGLNNWSYWVSNVYGPRLGYRFVPYKGTDAVPSDKIPANSNVDMAQAAPAHNLAALTLGELGYIGFALLLLMWLRWFLLGVAFLWKRTPDPMRRIGVGIFFGLAGMFLQSQTEWVFRQSPIHYVFHIMAGVLASLYYVRKREKKAEKALKARLAEEEYENLPAPAPGSAPA